MARSDPKPDFERGSALVSAVGLVLVFASLSLLTIHLMLDTAFLDQRQRHRLALNAAMDTAFSEALFVLSQPSSGVRHREAFVVETPLGDAEVRVVSPMGQIDINQASPLMLRLLLDAAGAEEPEALANAIIDWRDRNDLPSNNGAERDAYQRAGLDGPANRPFAHEDELDQVLGMTPEVLACLRSEVTISSHQSSPDLRLASPWLRQALSGQAGNENIQMPPVTLGTGDLIGLEMRLVEGTQAGQGVRALVRLTGDRQDLYLMQAWDPVTLTEGLCPEVAA